MDKGKVGMTRRELLKSSVALGATFMIGAGFLTAPDAAWALETRHIAPKTMATLVQMARDIYPHDRVATEFYVNAVKGYDNAQSAPMIEQGIANLDRVADSMYDVDYLNIGWEIDRVAVLEAIEESPFFQTIRGDMITGLYNQKSIWPLFGYEGESFSKGGYMNRGFDDINWL